MYLVKDPGTLLRSFSGLPGRILGQRRHENDIQTRRENSRAHHEAAKPSLASPHCPILPVSSHKCAQQVAERLFKPERPRCFAESSLSASEAKLVGSHPTFGELPHDAQYAVRQLDIFR